MDQLQGSIAHWNSLARHTPLGILCDLDGTLLPFASTPSQTQLPTELVDLLGVLSVQPGMRVAIVSGRPHEHLERFLGTVPNLWLVAEHGAWRRRGAAWESAVGPNNDDLKPLSNALQQLADVTPGALIEPKTWSVTIHYRLVPQLERAALLVAVTAVIDDWLARHPATNDWMARK